MNELTVIEHNSERVLTTQQIAEAYGTDIKTISWNFNHNKEHYAEGNHYYCLTGEALKTFFAIVNITNAKARTLYLWTEKGALLHAKSLNTEKAWQVYEHLIDTYFKAKEMFTVPKTLPEALRLAADLAERIEQDKPKVLFAEKCLKSTDSILIRELAKIASDEGFEVGERRLFAKLRAWGLLMPNNEPYQEYINRKYFSVIERPYQTYSGVKLAKTTKVLPMGQVYILNRLAKEAAI